MKHVTIIDKDVPQEDRPEGLAIVKAIISGKCYVCPYICRCEADRNFKFPANAACMKILKDSKQNSN